MNTVEFAERMTRQLDEADDEASEAQLAFTAGRFDEYWQRKADEALARVEAEYERYAKSDGGNGGPGSGSGTGGSAGPETDSDQ